MVMVEGNEAPMVAVVCRHNTLSFAGVDDKEEQLTGDLGSVKLPTRENFNTIV